MGRGARGRARSQGGALPQLRHQHARLPRRGRQPLVNDVARGVPDPETGVSTGQRLRARLLAQGYTREPAEDEEADEARRETRLAEAGGDLAIRALGSGSDYTPFLQHLGLTALSIEYHGEDDQSGVYHTAYDSFDHYVRFGDPGFAYGLVEAKTVGHLMLRMADADVLPLEFGGFADTLGAYAEELHKLTDDKRHKVA